MVGGRDRIETFDETKISALLKEYKERKKVEAIFGTKDEMVDFADKCLNNIEPYEKDIIVNTCIEGVSLRQYAKISGFSRDTVTKERKRILDMLARFFNKAGIGNLKTNESGELLTD